MRSALIVLVFLGGCASYAKLAPYSGIRWKQGTPEVELDHVWFELVAIDGVAAADVVSFARTKYGFVWRKRFEEDLVEVLSRMGRPPGPEVELAVKSLSNGEIRTFPRVPMTSENRQAIWEAAGTSLLEDQILTRADAEADLDILQRLLETQFAYRSRRGVDVRNEIGRIRARLEGSLSARTLGVEIVKLLALFGDGHSRLEQEVLSTGYAPFLVGDAAEGLVAYRERRAGYLDPDFPFLDAIDGLPLESWLKAAGRFVAAGSPDFIRAESIRALRFIQELRAEFGREKSEKLLLGLRSPDGRLKSLEVSVARVKPLYSRSRVDRESGLLNGGIGYLRIASMDDSPGFLRDLRKAMDRFRETRGLIIDVRGNGGGRRAALQTLFPYFLREEDGPRVANIAAARLGPGEERDRQEGYLENRDLYPVTASVWSPADRTVLERFGANFAPEWIPPREEFSAWHYFVLRPERGVPLYPHPVCVLMDTGCFSATDIFLGAFKGWRNVMLLGTPSGGGSGRPRRYTLPHSRLSVLLSSMASFRPDGSLFEGKGVQPDFLLRPRATDFAGETDSVLDAAIDRLR